MNPLKTLCFVACLVAAVCATPSQNQNRNQNQNQNQNQNENWNNNRGNTNRGNNSLRPNEWLSASELDSTPPVDQITMQQLENMSVQEGAKLIQKVYHLSQINHDLTPSFVPSPSNIPCHIVNPNGQKTTANLNTLPAACKQQQNFGEEEVTIFITGLPQQSQSVTKANKKLVQAYMQRYNAQQRQPQQNKDYDYGNDKQNQDRTSSEEDYNESWKTPKSSTGNLIVIDLGSVLNNFKRFAMLDVEQTGAMIGKTLVQLTNEADVPQEIMHIVAQGIAAHVAGAAARQYTRSTGHQLRRITALDPSKIMAKNPNTLTGLARGDAEFVDAIHTSTYGMGTPNRVGDVDFFPNGPSAGAPGADNVVEASMRATRYFAETVRPGNERNFPAVAANSLQQYKNNNGHGKRAYMGHDTEFDLEGDYMLEVNPHSPFGKSTPAQKQNSYHGVHQSWKNANNQDYE